MSWVSSLNFRVTAISNRVRSDSPNSEGEEAANLTQISFSSGDIHSGASPNLPTGLVAYLASLSSMRPLLWFADSGVIWLIGCGVPVIVLGVLKLRLYNLGGAAAF